MAALIEKADGLQISEQIAQQCGISASEAGNLMQDLDNLLANLRNSAQPDAP